MKFGLIAMSMFISVSAFAVKGKQRNGGDGFGNICIGNGGTIVCFCYGADKDLGSKFCNEPACAPTTSEGSSCGVNSQGKSSKGMVKPSKQNINELIPAVKQKN